MAAIDLFAAMLANPGGLTFPTPGALARHLDPRIVNTDALELIDRELMWAYTTPDARLAISIPPQEGKTARASQAFPVWILGQNPDTRIALASFSTAAARRVSRGTRDLVTDHPDLGLTLRGDVKGVSEWQLLGHDGGMYAVGMAGSLTGRPVDVLIIDDPFKDQNEAASEVFRERAWQFWLKVGATRLAPGAPVIVIQTRWHEDDLIGRLVAAEDGHRWRVINIPAQADHDPSKGETDPLGRQPGDYLVSARGRTVAQWEAIKITQGSQGWNALYQGRPSPAEGGILKRAWWGRYDTPVWVEHDNGTRTVPGASRLITSWDMTFKDGPGSDYVVGQVWALRGADAYLVDQIRARLDFPATEAAVKKLAARWPQANLHLVEDKANGPAILSQLRRQLPGLVPVTPKDSKEARASAVAPYVEARNVYLPASGLAPWIDGLIDEAAAFPNGAHDDQVDALTQALARLYVNGGTASTFLAMLAPPCPACSTPIPRTANGICPGCGHNTLEEA